MRKMFVVLALVPMVVSACGGQSAIPGNPVGPSPSAGPNIVTTSLPPATRGAEYSARVEAVGGQEPRTLSATGLPNGLTMAPDGVVSGRPIRTYGNFDIAVTVRDAAGVTNTANVSLNVANYSDGREDFVLPNGEPSGLTMKVIYLRPPAGAHINPLPQYADRSGSVIFASNRGIRLADMCAENRCLESRYDICNETDAEIRVETFYGRAGGNLPFRRWRNMAAGECFAGIFASTERQLGSTWELSFYPIPRGATSILLTAADGSRWVRETRWTYE